MRKTSSKVRENWKRFQKKIYKIYKTLFINSLEALFIVLPPSKFNQSPQKPFKSQLESSIIHASKKKAKFHHKNQNEFPNAFREPF